MSIWTKDEWKEILSTALIKGIVEAIVLLVILSVLGVL